MGVPMNEAADTVRNAIINGNWSDVWATLRGLEPLEAALVSAAIRHGLTDSEWSTFVKLLEDKV
jgi:hypothetical protein